MRKSETRTIGENTYIVAQLGALKGRTVFAKLLKVAGPLMAGGDLSAVSHIPDEALGEFCDAFASCTQVKIGDKQPNLSDIFDVHFAGCYDEMLAWLGFCIELNFGSVLKKGLEGALAEGLTSA